MAKNLSDIVIHHQFRLQKQQQLQQRQQQQQLLLQKQLEDAGRNKEFFEGLVILSATPFGAIQTLRTMLAHSTQMLPKIGLEEGTAT